MALGRLQLTLYHFVFLREADDVQFGFLILLLFHLAFVLLLAAFVARCGAGTALYLARFSKQIRMC